MHEFLDWIPLAEIMFSLGNWFFIIGFCNMSTPGNTSRLMFLIFCLLDTSRGWKPKTEVHVSLSSEIAGMINFSTFKEHKAWYNGPQKVTPRGIASPQSANHRHSSRKFHERKKSVNKYWQHNALMHKFHAYTLMSCALEMTEQVIFHEHQESNK